jgi:hypothetical protein
MERLGGIDFDEALFTRAMALVKSSGVEIDGNDPATLAALARLREECRRAKEALSSDTDATIQIFLPGIQQEMRLTRPEFEEMVRPRIRETIQALERAARSAGLGFADLDRVLLVGGSSRIPRGRDGPRGDRQAVAGARTTMALGAARRRSGPRAGWSRRRGGGVAGRRSGIPGRRAGAGRGRDRRRQRLSTADAPARADASSTRGPMPCRRATRRFSAGVAVAAPFVPMAAILAGIALVAVIALVVGTTRRHRWVGVAIAIGGLVSGRRRRRRRHPPHPAANGPPSRPDPAPGRHHRRPRRRGVQSGHLSRERLRRRVRSIPFPGHPGTLHPFFWDTIPPTKAGSPTKSSNWILYDGSSPFLEYKVKDRPAGAKQMCVLVANHDHTVVQKTGNCWPLPD